MSFRVSAACPTKSKKALGTSPRFEVPGTYVCVHEHVHVGHCQNSSYMHLESVCSFWTCVAYSIPLQVKLFHSSYISLQERPLRVPSLGCFHHYIQVSAAELWTTVCTTTFMSRKMITRGAKWGVQQFIVYQLQNYLIFSARHFDYKVYMNLSSAHLHQCPYTHAPSPTCTRTRHAIYTRVPHLYAHMPLQRTPSYTPMTCPYTNHAHTHMRHVLYTHACTVGRVCGSGSEVYARCKSIN